MWAYLVKESCENEILSDSLSNNNIPAYTKIFLYTKEYKKVEFDRSLTINVLNFRKENISNYTEAEILGISQKLVMNDGILSEKYTDIETQTFKKDTYNLKGDLIDSKVEEYIITFVPTNDSSRIRTYITTDLDNQEITIN